MSTWERIRYYDDDDGRRKTVIFRNPTEVMFMGHQCLAGIEVDEEDEEVVPRGGIVHERRHILDTDLIIWRKPLKMNNHYGMLEEA